MPNIPIDDQQATHLGWQRGDMGRGDDQDHLVIDGSFEKPQTPSKMPVISFNNPTQGLKQPSEMSDHPGFINVDSQGLESPLELLRSQGPLDDHAVHPMVRFSDESNQETSLDSNDQQVFS